MNKKPLQPEADTMDSINDKLTKEFAKMSTLLQQERKNFDMLMAQQRAAFNDEVLKKIQEIVKDRAELDKARAELSLEKAELDNKMQKMRVEIEKESRTKAIEETNAELAKARLAAENEIKKLQQEFKKEEEKHFQKMAALKKENHELERDIEQKLFLTSGNTQTGLKKNSQELIVQTVTGDSYRGYINIGFNERLSDMFTKVKSQFIIIYDAKVKGEEKATVFINKQNIVSIKPLDEAAKRKPMRPEHSDTM